MEDADQLMDDMGVDKNPIFEVNPEHALVKRLKDKQDDSLFSD